MNLLLFLSALLSALTGVVGGGRAAQAPQYEAVAVTTAQVAVAPVRLSARPVMALPTLADAAGELWPATIAVVGLAVPLYAGRRRE